jgi:hypothetical protein
MNDCAADQLLADVVETFDEPPPDTIPRDEVETRS